MKPSSVTISLADTVERDRVSDVTNLSVNTVVATSSVITIFAGAVEAISPDPSSSGETFEVASCGTSQIRL